MGQTYLAEPDADGEEVRTLRPLQAAAITYRIAFGPRAGQKMLTLRGAMPRETTTRQPLCADIDGNRAACRGAGGRTRTQAAGTAVPLHHPAGAFRRAGATRRCRAAGAEAQDAVARRHHAPGAESGRTTVPADCRAPDEGPELCEGAACKVVATGVHAAAGGACATAEAAPHSLFHGVLAPNSKLRALVVPHGPEAEEQVTEPAAANQCDAETITSPPHRIGWARLLKRVFSYDIT
jgi:hypothetical protein